MLLTFLFLYAPIVLLIVFSFNDSKSNAVWGGFTQQQHGLERLFPSLVCKAVP